MVLRIRVQCTAMFLIIVALPLCARAGETQYDPLNTSSLERIVIVDLTVVDDARQREIPLRVYLPPGSDESPVILFSHGLGGSCRGSACLGNHWAARGYVAVFVQHPGSDESVWKNVPRRKQMKALKEAANAKNFMLRVKDIPAVLNQLDVWNTDSNHPLSGRMNLERVGMAGHSFGAVTTQAVSGQQMGRLRVNFTDERIDAALLMSPGCPRQGDPDQVFGSVSIPWLLMTGTNDTAAITPDVTPESRLKVFSALPPGGKYELVLFGAEHSAFSDRALPGDQQKRNPNHHRAILAISTAFWDTCLKEDPDAKAWLDGNGPRSVLETKDRWQKK